MPQSIAMDAVGRIKPPKPCFTQIPSIHPTLLPYKQPCLSRLYQEFQIHMSQWTKIHSRFLATTLPFRSIGPENLMLKYLGFIIYIFVSLGPGRPSAGGPRMDRRAVTSSGVVKISRLASRLRRSARRGPHILPRGCGPKLFLTRGPKRPFRCLDCCVHWVSCLLLPWFASMVKSSTNSEPLFRGERIVFWWPYTNTIRLFKSDRLRKRVLLGHHRSRIVDVYSLLNISMSGPRWNKFQNICLVHFSVFFMMCHTYFHHIFIPDLIHQDSFTWSNYLNIFSCPALHLLHLPPSQPSQRYLATTLNSQNLPIRKDQ